MNKIKRFIQENYMFLLFNIVLIALLTYPLPYYIYTGGGILEVNDKIIISNKTESKGSYNLCYVSEIQANSISYLLSYIMPNWDMVGKEEVAINKNENDKEIQIRDKLYLKQANNSAIISAFKSANKEYKIIEVNPVVLGKSSEANTNLEIGDEIISIDEVNIDTIEELGNYLDTKNIGDTLKIKVKNNNKEYYRTSKVVEFENKKKIGIYLEEITTYETNPEIKFNFKTNEGGPSGGFMISLALYDYLVDKDLTNGLKISGTGTIDNDGNVGAIGGVKYKLAGAVKAKSNIFFVPNEENYEEAMKLKKKYNYNIEIVGVDKLEDAINYLENR